MFDYEFHLEHNGNILFLLWTDFTCWNVFYWSRNNIIQYVNYFTLQTKYIKNSLHLVATKFCQWNECFARSLWSLASLRDPVVPLITLTLKWLCFHFIQKIWFLQDIISNMVVVFMPFLWFCSFFLFFDAKS